MTERQPDQRILPSATADLRGRAVLALMTKISGSFDWKRDLALTLSDVPTALLPHAVRSYALQNYVEPGMSEVHVRRILENALTLKVQEGTIKGVKYALSLLGMTVHWTQWHKMSPMGAPGTHKVRVFINEYVFSGEPLLSERTLSAAVRMIETTKRHSQDIAFEVAVAGRQDIGLAAALCTSTALRVTGAIEPPQPDITCAIGFATAGRAVEIVRINGTTI